MSFTRQITHYSPGPADNPQVVSDRAVAGAWFELHRQGGCGSGELKLLDGFPARDQIDIGHWIAFDYQTGDRWYLGRVESRQADSPAGVTFRLEGMSALLGEVFPGGFGLEADGAAPHRYARTDLFFHDPDYSAETVDSVDEPHELVALLLQQYVAPATAVLYDPARIESPLFATETTSFKFRGEESVRSIVKELAILQRNAAWGVDETGTFFFLNPKSTLSATWREGVSLLRLEESRDREHLFNRVLLTGGYVYDEPINSEVTVRGFFRWRGNYIQPASRDEHGERRIRLWVPWIRTRSDSREFVREFFRVYAEPTTRYLVEVANQSSLPKPWEGRVRIEDRTGAELITAQIETIRVQFDHAPRFRMELGPEDPRTHWPEPPHDERWEIPADPLSGGIITFSDLSSSDSLTSLDSSESIDSSDSNDDSSEDSEASSDNSSSDNASSDSSDNGSSAESSEDAPSSDDEQSSADSTSGAGTDSDGDDSESGGASDPSSGTSDSEDSESESEEPNSATEESSESFV